MTERELRNHPTVQPGDEPDALQEEAAGMDYYDWMLRELILRPWRFYSRGAALASMAAHKAEREEAKKPKAGR